VTKEVALTWDGSDIPDMDQVEQSLLRYEDQWVKSWSVDSLKVDKEALLDVVDRVFPDGPPEAQPDGSISGVDRSKVLQALLRS
jgi:hypothetical protein